MNNCNNMKVCGVSKVEGEFSDVRDIEREIQRLSQATEECLSKVIIVEARLQPIISPTPTVANNEKNPEPSTIIGTQIRKNSDAVDATIDILNRILNTIEI